MLIRDLISLTGKNSVITGAAGHIGSAIANSLAELGSDLILVDLPESDLIKKSQLLVDRWGVKVKAISCDLSSSDGRVLLIKEIISNLNSLDILVNNAAFIGTSNLNGWSVPFEDQTVEIWNQVMEVNLVSVFHLCKDLYPLMKKSNAASIVNIASIYGIYGPDWRLYQNTNMANPAAYAASKGGLIQLTKWMATTMAPFVRVNAISPGGVLRNQPFEFQERYISKTPLARMATEDDFIGAIAYLTTNMSAYVTGQILEVDGGWGVW